MAQPPSLRDSLPGLGRLLRRFWPYVRRERRLVTASLVALYAEIGLRLLEPWPLKVVLDRILAPSTAHGHAGSGLHLLRDVDPATLLEVKRFTQFARMSSSQRAMATRVLPVPVACTRSALRRRASKRSQMRLMDSTW